MVLTVDKVYGDIVAVTKSYPVSLSVGGRYSVEQLRCV